MEREFGVDFTHCEPSTVTRRVERRLQLSRAEHIDACAQRVREEREELDVPYRDLGVTRFFRNDEAFRVMEDRVLPERWLSLPEGAPLRIGVAGCATGKTSIRRRFCCTSQRLGERPVEIFATDVPRGSLDLATRGLYDEQAVAGVSPARLERHFLKRGPSYQVSPGIRRGGQGNQRPLRGQAGAGA